MDTDRGETAPGLPPEVDALMRLLAHLNAVAMLVLCVWLGSAALDYSARQADPTVVSLQQCGCDGGAGTGGALAGDLR